MGELKKILKPSYLKDFKCIGSFCEDSCCIGWNIDIDKLTYRKYFRTQNIEMKQKFKKYLYKNEECDFEEIDYGQMKIPESKWCPFLNKNKLCEIYCTLGEDYLSNVCHSYPRIYNVLNGVYEMSLYMSCPEAVRLLLLNKNKITFKEEKIELDKYIIHSYVDTKDKQWKHSPIINLKKLRTISIDTVQNRKYTIEQRLSFLGNKLIQNKNTTPLKTDNSYAFQINFFKELIKILNVFKEIDSPLFIQYTNNLITHLKLKENINLKDSTVIYQKIMNTVVEPFLSKNPYLFEHYLVNSIFQGNFPFNINQNQFDGYIMLVVRYSFIKFYLAGTALTKEKITIDDVVSIVQVHTKTINHHNSFINETLENIKNKQFDNLDFTSILLGL